jgi:hypothetical protein
LEPARKNKSWTSFKFFYKVRNVFCLCITPNIIFHTLLACKMYTK